jgi:predicted AAA+ superfamily ATPase
LTSAGRFVLLVSAHFNLRQRISESLAGRIGFLDLDPFAYVEVAGARLADLWLRGGFPDPCLTPNRGARRDWMDAYLRTFLERDLAGLAIEVSLSQMRRFWYLLAAANGTIWNASELGRSLGLSYHTIQRYADLVEQAFLLRRLPPYFANLGKRLVKSPKVYLTDTGLLHAFLGVETEQQLDRCPQRGASWEGFIIEQIIRREKLTSPASRFYFWPGDRPTDRASRRADRRRDQAGHPCRVLGLENVAHRPAGPQTGASVRGQPDRGAL